MSLVIETGEFNVPLGCVLGYMEKCKSPRRTVSLRKSWKAGEERWTYSSSQPSRSDSANAGEKLYDRRSENTTDKDSKLTSLGHKCETLTRGWCCLVQLPLEWAGWGDYEQKVGDRGRRGVEVVGVQEDKERWGWFDLCRRIAMTYGKRSQGPNPPIRSRTSFRETRANLRKTALIPATGSARARH